ncbi:hypothetical protein [Haloarchaeobius sp. HME9146]|uniref:hypothetical protein n=1 Tax=Haloarchaeobius sp. HME9146 TaxID=2978732 RepID=UPI0021C13A68|nr:hypothetical protein [Haloarchaeobius sp. HME9146]MCT9095726.1 hypothetical protein [Haloarchaeobius sp. HME9146]
MRQATKALLLAVLLVLAGCNTMQSAPGTTATDTTAPGTTAEPTTVTQTEATATPTTTPALATETTNAPSVSTDLLPPGVNDSGLADVTTLWQAHTENVNDDDDGYRHVLTLANRSGGERVIRLHSDGPRARGVLAGGDTETHAWMGDDGNVSAVWNTTSAQRSYYSHAGLDGIGPLYVLAFAEGYPNFLLEYGEFAVDGTVERDGQRYVRLRATGVNNENVSGFQLSQFFGGGRFADMSGTVLVTPEGTVTAMDLELYDEGADTPALRADFDLQTDVASVERPDWLGEVPRLAVSTAEPDPQTSTDRLLVAKNTGDDALAAGTNVTLSLYSQELGNVTVPESVDPGETMYLYVVGSTYDGELRVAVGDRPTLPEDAAAFAVVDPFVKVEQGSITASFGIPDNESAETSY